MKTYDPAIAARKERNRQIYQETMQICRDGGYATATGRVDLPANEDVLNASRFYVNPPEVDKLPPVEGSVVDAVNGDCIEVTRDLVEKGYRPVLLNMANRHTPGGGVLDGARAQEESLFRQSNLCVSLYRYDEYHAGLLGLPPGTGRYPMDRNTGGIYSGRVTFFRTGQRDGDKLVDSPFECAVVSVAAINRPDLDAQGRLVDWAVEATEKKIRTMLRIGLLHGHDAIVLGAWGCGAFRNPPEHMAEIFRKVLNEAEFVNKFKVVRFAVIEDHNSNNRNFKAFDREFNGTDRGGRGATALPDACGGRGATALPDARGGRVKGMLWGLLIGDAFGSPIQFSSKDGHPWITEMVPCPVFHLPAGYWTDDGSMALCVMDSFARKNGYDLKDIGDTFVKWLFEGYLSSKDGQSFDVGGATYSSVAAIRRGSLVNGEEESQGNGSIMRFAPGYLIARALNRPEIIHEVSDLTHASKAVRKTCDEFAAVLDEHLAGRRAARGPGKELDRADVPNSGWCVDSLKAALWAFNTTTTFEDGLVAAVNLGGDSDSIGAVFGQIAGAYYGFDAIPPRWVSAMKDSSGLATRIDDFIERLSV